MGSTLQPTVTGASAASTGSRLPLSRRGSRGLVSRIADYGDPSMPRGLSRIQSEGQKQVDRTDALWAQMQSTLEEVELTAANGTHVFGPDHTKALEGLRMAQISLAQAWARSEADDAKDADGDGKGGKSSALGSEARSTTNLTEPQSNRNSGSARPGTATSALRREESKLEDETEADIKLARQRRIANDKYFNRVNEGVLDVVQKLEDVAAAMKAVEKQSRDIWEDSETSPTTEAAK